MGKDKITIGIFNDSFFPMTDGVVSVVNNYAKELVKYAEVIVFVPKYFRKNFDDSVFPYKVVRCHSIKIPKLDYSLPIPRLDSKFLKELKKYNLDIVHIHSPFTIGRAGARYAKRHKIPCVATMHTQFRQDIKKAVKSNALAEQLNKRLIRVFNRCTECWAVNNEVARIYYEDYKCKKLPKVMNNATEMLPVDYNTACAYVNKLYGLTQDEKVFIFVGRINTLKNVLFIADVIAKIKEHKPNFNYKMLFVGSGHDEKKLKNRIAELGIQDKVIMCGKITDRKVLAQHYSRADLMLFPSNYDASSIVQIEAASQKTPTVFLKNSATACNIKDNENGYLSELNTDIFAQRIIEILNNQELYKTVSENAFKTVYKNWDTEIQNVFELYKKLIENNKQKDFQTNSK